MLSKSKQSNRSNEILNETSKKTETSLKSKPNEITVLNVLPVATTNMLVNLMIQHDDIKNVLISHVNAIGLDKVSYAIQAKFEIVKI